MAESDFCCFQLMNKVERTGSATSWGSTTTLVSSNPLVLKKRLGLLSASYLLSLSRSTEEKSQRSLRRKAKFAWERAKFSWENDFKKDPASWIGNHLPKLSTDIKTEIVHISASVLDSIDDTTSTIATSKSILGRKSLPQRLKFLTRQPSSNDSSFDVSPLKLDKLDDHNTTPEQYGLKRLEWDGTERAELLRAVLRSVAITAGVLARRTTDKEWRDYNYRLQACTSLLEAVDACFSHPLHDPPLTQNASWRSVLEKTLMLFADINTPAANVSLARAVDVARRAVTLAEVMLPAGGPN